MNFEMVSISCCASDTRRATPVTNTVISYQKSYEFNSTSIMYWTILY
jgi:hypothetical protein